MSNAAIFARGTEQLLQYKFAQKRMTGWFEFQELKMQLSQNYSDPDTPEARAASCASHPPASRVLTRVRRGAFRRGYGCGRDGRGAFKGGRRYVAPGV